MKDLLIRNFEKKDAEEIKRILSSISKDFINDHHSNIIEEQLKNSLVISLVVEFKGQVVGFMISYIILCGFGLDKNSWITLMGVEPKYMAQGIGRKLAEQILKKFKEENIKQIYSVVSWDSIDLISFLKFWVMKKVIL